MPIREESYDLFGAASGSPAVYSYEKAVSTSANGSIDGNALDLRAVNPALDDDYRVHAEITTTVVGATSVQIVVKTCATNSSTAGDWKTILTGPASTTLTKGTPLLDARLPVDCKRWIKATCVNVGTATAGKVGGHVLPMYQ